MATSGPADASVAPPPVVLPPVRCGRPSSTGPSAARRRSDDEADSHGRSRSRSPTRGDFADDSDDPLLELGMDEEHTYQLFRLFFHVRILFVRL